MHKVTSAILVAFNTAHRAAATASAATRTKLVDLHVKNLSKMVKRADARIDRFVKLKMYHAAQTRQANDLVKSAVTAALKASKDAQEEAAKHGVTKYF